jgi:hypothetical protein
VRRALKVLSIAISLAAIAGAVVVSDRAPLTPAHLVRTTRDARINLDRAEENTDETVESTEGFALIAHNVRSQVQSSETLLRIQRGLERSSVETAATSIELRKALAGLARDFSRAAAPLDRVNRLAQETAAAGVASAGAAERLFGALLGLRARFDKVLKESRELNRKARGFAELRDGP